MTPTLMKYPAHERALLLSRLVDRYLPTPGIDPLPDVTPEDAAIQEKILEEIKGQLQLVSDEEPEAQKAMLECLSHGMSGAVLENADLRAIEARLGQRGALPISSYRVVVPKKFLRENSSSGLSRNEVRSVIVNADNIQHLHFTEPEHPGRDLSFFIKHSRGGSEDRFTAFVQAIREGEQLTAQAAWRVYHSDVDVRSAQSPEDYLRAFVASYGLQMRVGDKTGKFITDEFVPVRALSKVHPQEVVRLLVEKPREGGMAVFGKSVVGLVRKGIQIYIAYSIDITKYKRDLRKHGVRV